MKKIRIQELRYQVYVKDSTAFNKFYKEVNEMEIHSESDYNRTEQYNLMMIMDSRNYFKIDNRDVVRAVNILLEEDLIWLKQYSCEMCFDWNQYTPENYELIKTINE